MQVLLRSDVSGIGRRGDIVTVSSGHARNYLLPKGLAVEASAGTVAQAAAMQRARSAREAADRESALTIAAALAQRAVMITAKAGAEGRLFGSVTANDVVAAVDEQFGIALDRKKVEIGEPIRTLGAHSVSVNLFGDVTGTVRLEVVAR
ncbi:MAG: 50S ribosomal protein L9 [Ilumatobacteraceae bacterium]|jgi:large subunit ribosomal protein L9